MFMYIWGALKSDQKKKKTKTKKKKNTDVDLVANFDVLLSSSDQYVYKSQIILSFEILKVFSI